jgi:hypothetical protein
MMAASIPDAAEQQRHARIEAFLEDASAPVPAPVRGPESMPAWFGIRNWINVSAFDLVIAGLLRLVLQRAGVGPG